MKDTQPEPGALLATPTDTPPTRRSVLLRLGASCAGVGTGLVWTPALHAQTGPAAEPTPVPEPALLRGVDLRPGLPLILPASHPGRRTLAPLDSLLRQWLQSGTLAPQAGHTLPAADGQTVAWRAAEGGAAFLGSGRLADAAFGAGGTLWLPIESPRAQTVLVRAQRALWLQGPNGLRVADIYGSGQLQVPLALRAGPNPLLLRGGRGALALEFAPAPPGVSLLAADPTLPDLAEQQGARRFDAAVLLLNADSTWSQPLRLLARVEHGDKPAEWVPTAVPALPPLSTRKLPIAFDAPALALRGGLDQLTLTVQLREPAGAAEGRLVSERRYALRVRHLLESRRVTYTSRIDESVQHYGLKLADRTPHGVPERPGLIVALHGANYEAIDLAADYAAKPWAHVVTPNNRRRFGHNWEDWGRLDLLEALAHASAEHKPDPDRVLLTGHSMGGHGTWLNGALLAEHWAVVAPSAGWATIWSYADAPRPRAEAGGAVEAVLARASSVADTMALLPNLAGRGVFVLHPAADEQVPVAEARTLVAELARTQRDFAYQERPDGVHWWGASVVDWPPLMDFAARRRRPAPADELDIDFSTPDPAISHRRAWVQLHQQQRMGGLSRVQLQAERAARRIRGTSHNVECLALDLRALALPGEGGVELKLDDQTLALSVPAPGALNWLRRAPSGDWSVAGPPPAAHKQARRGGRLTEAFRHGLCFVVATGGTPEENRWSLEKARYDAEVFAYRSNGGVRVLLDSDADARNPGARNLVLYGHADSHRLWPRWLGDSPIQVRRGEVQVGPRTLRGEDIGALFVRPRADSDVHQVVVIAGSGAVGARVAERIGWWSGGGLGFADWLLAGPELFERGWDGIRGTGFFGNDWGYSEADSGWRAKP